MDFDTLRTISNILHFVAFPAVMFAWWVEELVGYFDSQIPEEYR